MLIVNFKVSLYCWFRIDGSLMAQLLGRNQPERGVDKAHLFAANGTADRKFRHGTQHFIMRTPDVTGSTNFKTSSDVMDLI